MNMTKKKLSDKEISNIKNRVLSDIDQDGASQQNTPMTINEDLILTQPLTSGRIVSKLMNKVFHLPLFMFKKATYNYVTKRTLNDDMVRQGIDEILDRERASTESILSKLDDKVYEFMKQNDALKSELMAEINKNEGLANVGDSKNEVTQEKIINKDKLKSCKKINVGSGSHILEDYINIDHREIEGVDIVGDISKIPLGPQSLDEVFASHVVEHFTERQIIPILKHWYSLLIPGGKIRIIVPDIENMSIQFAAGNISWNQLRTVTLGGQDYSSDYHLNTFSVEYISELTKKALPGSIMKTVASSRKNGECLELEVEIIKPTK